MNYVMKYSPADARVAAFPFFWMNKFTRQDLFVQVGSVPDGPFSVAVWDDDTALRAISEDAALARIQVDIGRVPMGFTFDPDDDLMYVLTAGNDGLHIMVFRYSW